MVLDIGVDTLWHYIHCHGTRHRVTKHASNYRWCACHILPLLGGGWKYRKGGEDIVTIFSPRGENIVRYFHPGVRILGGENIVSHRQGRQAYPSRHTRRGAASLPCLMIDAGGREWAHWRTKSFISLSFLARWLTDVSTAGLSIRCAKTVSVRLCDVCQTYISSFNSAPITTRLG